MGWKGKAPAAAVLAALALCAPAWAGSNATVATPRAWLSPPLSAPLSAEAADIAAWIARSRDQGNRPFVIVDKRHARIHVFDAAARLQGSSAVLLGQAVGDASAPQVGAHAQAGKVPFEERTTPAGRFVSEPGRNDKGESVIWVDYDSAFAMHRVRPGPGLRDREKRLASPVPSDHRVSLGCVVMPVAFYLGVVERVLGEGRAIVYVMPENGSARELFMSM